MAVNRNAEFRQFDRDNPEIWRLFVLFTAQRINQGFKHYGARDVLHRIRWETAVAEESASGFKINNDWSPWYARKFHKTYPAFGDFFYLRSARADRP